MNGTNSVFDPTRITNDKESITAPGRLFIISAPSGTGKTTLCRAVRKRIPDLKYSISYTTRLPRKGEIDGKDYHFITTSEFSDRISNKGWAEWAERQI